MALHPRTRVWGIHPSVQGPHQRRESLQFDPFGRAYNLGPQNLKGDVLSSAATCLRKGNLKNINPTRFFVVFTVPLGLRVFPPRPDLAPDFASINISMLDYETYVLSQVTSLRVKLPLKATALGG